MKGKNKICMSHKIAMKTFISLEAYNIWTIGGQNFKSWVPTGNCIPELGWMFNLTHLGLYPKGKIQCNICFIGENLPKSKTKKIKILQRVIFLITIEIGHIECTCACHFLGLKLTIWIGGQCLTFGKPTKIRSVYCWIKNEPCDFFSNDCKVVRCNFSSHICIYIVQTQWKHFLFCTFCGPLQPLALSMFLHLQN